MYCWILAWRILSITLLACDKLPKNFKQKHLLSRAVSLGQELRSTLDSDSGLESLRMCGLSAGAVSHPKASPGQKGCLPRWLRNMPCKWALVGSCHIEKVLAPWVAAGFSQETEAVSLLQTSLGSPIQSLVTQIRSIECEREYHQVRTPRGQMRGWHLRFLISSPPTISSSTQPPLPAMVIPLTVINNTVQSVQSLSRVQLCDPMNPSTPGLPVHHQLPEFTQTHVHRVSDAIQPSHPLSSPSPPAPNPSQHHSLFQWVNSSHEVAKVLEFQL